MQRMLLLWNLVNLIDAEGGWFVKLIGVLALTGIITYLLEYGLVKLHQKFEENNKIWQDTFVRAISRPLRYYIWFASLAHSVNLISDHLLSEQFINELKLTFSVLAVLAISWFLLRWKINLLKVLIEKQKKQEIHIDTGRILGFGKLATALIVIVTALLLMEVTGQSFQTLIAFGGISGLALAIASQEIIGNFFGGLMLYVTRPFTVGDYVHLPSSNLEGTIEDIGWYQTCLRGPDKRPIYIPNALFSKAYVINGTRMTHRRITETISVRHDDLHVIPQIIHDLHAYLTKHDGIDIGEKVVVNIDSVGPYSIDIALSALSVHTAENSFLKLRDELFLKAVQTIHQHGAKLATPMHNFFEKSASGERTMVQKTEATE